MTAYDAAFYDDQADGSALAATKYLDILAERSKPSSVVDVGCGVGTWLSAAMRQGIDDVLGLDGDYVDRSLLRIPAERFRATDLSKPVGIDRRFDLAISVEVAEHISASSAASFVGTLTSLSDVVLFSAAIPYQGGTYHVNESWPENWKRLFEGEGYVPVDLFRPRLWTDHSIPFWYRQNVVLYVKREALSPFADVPEGFPLSAVHPEMYLWAVARTGGSEPRNHGRDLEHYRSVTERETPAIGYGAEFDVRMDNLPKRLARKAANVVMRLARGV